MRGNEFNLPTQRRYYLAKPVLLLRFHATQESIFGNHEQSGDDLAGLVPRVGLGDHIVVSAKLVYLGSMIRKKCMRPDWSPATTMP